MTLWKLTLVFSSCYCTSASVSYSSISTVELSAVDTSICDSWVTLILRSLRFGLRYCLVSLVYKVGSNVALVIFLFIDTKLWILRCSISTSKFNSTIFWRMYPIREVAILFEGTLSSWVSSWESSSSTLTSLALTFLVRTNLVLNLKPF